VSGDTPKIRTARLTTHEAMFLLDCLSVFSSENRAFVQIFPARVQFGSSSSVALILIPQEMWYVSRSELAPPTSHVQQVRTVRVPFDQSRPTSPPFPS
jgi:hypothetical protein